MRVTPRLVLQIGFSCNARCKFCYYQDALRKGTVKDFSLKNIKKKLKEGKSLGKYMVDISGGEPTIHKHIFEILKYAKSIGYTRICIITNGIRTGKNKEFCDKLIKAGMNEVLLSIHSPVKKHHDYLTNIPNSYDNIISTLKYLSTKKNFQIRINSTISKVNYKTLDKLFKLVKPYKPNAINLLILNPTQETYTGDDSKIVISDYNIIMKHVKKEIENFEKNFNIINIRFSPFCLLPGHEEKIRTIWQKLYEDEEWCPYLNIKYNKGIIPVILSFCAGLLLYPFKTPKIGKRDMFTLFNEIITTFRGFYYYVQLSECRHCSLKKICPGLSRSYIKKFGKNQTELKAYHLEKTIDDPLYFCKDYSKNFESLRISKNAKS